jgi:hypothetical protein
MCCTHSRCVSVRCACVCERTQRDISHFFVCFTQIESKYVSVRDRSPPFSRSALIASSLDMSNSVETKSASSGRTSTNASSANLEQPQQTKRVWYDRLPLTKCCFFLLFRFLDLHQSLRQRLSKESKRKRRNIHLLSTRRIDFLVLHKVGDTFELLTSFVCVCHRV